MLSHFDTDWTYIHQYLIQYGNDGMVMEDCPLLVGLFCTYGAVVSFILITWIADLVSCCSVARVMGWRDECVLCNTESSTVSPIPVGITQQLPL